MKGPSNREMLVPKKLRYRQILRELKIIREESWKKSKIKFKIKKIYRLKGIVMLIIV